MYQRSRRRLEACTTTRVRSGSCPPSSLKIFAKTGTMNMSIAQRTSVAKVKTTVGYTIAPLTRRLIFVSFSICSATRSRTLSSIPDASPACTIDT